MAELSWIKAPPKTVLEIEFTIKISQLVRIRYWIARQLIALAAWVINSDVIFRETLPVSEIK